MAQYGVSTSNMFSVLKAQNERAAKKIALDSEARRERRDSKDRKDARKDRAKEAQKQLENDLETKVVRRVYDRRSGTGRPKNEMKKEGAGRHNWGSLESASLEAPEDANKAKAQVKPKERGGERRRRDRRRSEKMVDGKQRPQQGAEGDAVQEASADVVEHVNNGEPVITTYDDYMEAKKQKEAKIKATEKRIVDEQIPDGFVKHQGKSDRLSDIGWFGGEEGRHTNAEHEAERKKEKKHKAVLDMDFQFARTGKNGEKGGSRRGGRDGGKPRMDVERQRGIGDLESERDFPMLSSRVKV